MVLVHEPIKERVQVEEHIAIGVLLDQKRCRGVLHENGEQTVARAALLQPLRDLAGDLVKALTPRGHLEAMPKLLPAGATQR